MLGNYLSFLNNLQFFQIFEIIKPHFPKIFNLDFENQTISGLFLKKHPQRTGGFCETNRKYWHFDLQATNYIPIDLAI